MKGGSHSNRMQPPLKCQSRRQGLWLKIAPGVPGCGIGIDIGVSEAGPGTRTQPPYRSPTPSPRRKLSQASVDPALKGKNIWWHSSSTRHANNETWFAVHLFNGRIFTRLKN